MIAFRILGLGPQRWVDVDERSLPTSTAIVVVASVLLALNRLGGLVTQSPRAFARLGTVAIWGWLGLAVAVWAMTSITGGRRPSPRLVATITRRAHMPLIVIAFVLFGAAGLFQALWPGRVAVSLAVAVFIPATIVGGLVHTAGLRWRTAIIAGCAPYLGWLMLIGRELHQQLGHLY